MSYASKKWTENYIGQTLKTAKEQGLLGSGGGGSLIGFEDYSEEEHVIGRWLDGRPLYRKVINNIHITSRDGDFYVCDVTNMYLIDYEAIFTGKNGTEKINRHNLLMETLHISNNKLYYYFSYSQSSMYQLFEYCDIIVYYTKTTDEPGSFTNQMIASQFECTGIGYDNYSEDEVCVGKWIDGKPLYRKVINKPYNCTSGVDFVVSEFSSDISIKTFEGLLLVSDGTIQMLNAYYDASYNSLFYISQNKLTGKIRGWTSGTVISKVYYTKSTDEPNSFTPDMVYNGMIDASEATDDDVKEVFS